MKEENILGVSIDDVYLEEATGIVTDWLKSGKKHYVVTPNPEFIMAAQDDLIFRKILNKADLAIPDGSGLKLSGKIKHTAAGIDLMEKLCQISAEKNFTVGFIGGRDGVAKKASERLQNKYHGLKIVFAEDGPDVDKNGNVIAKPSALRPSLRLEENEVTRQSNIEDRHAPLAMTEKVDFLFVGFGAVKQEKWIAKNLDKLPVRVAMGVGGSFDYLSGNALRAPSWIRKLGVEWLFRLILQPWRIKRQFQLLRFVLLLHQSPK